VEKLCEEALCFGDGPHEETATSEEETWAEVKAIALCPGRRLDTGRSCLTLF
jgi:hypothetical protein